MNLILPIVILSSTSIQNFRMFFESEVGIDKAQNLFNSPKVFLFVLMYAYICINTYIFAPDTSIAVIDVNQNGELKFSKKL